jgi:hypothetical protein
MAEIPNVTERIAELREHKKARSLTRAPHPAPDPGVSRKTVREAPEKTPERMIATNYSVIAIYAVLFGALLAQLFLIALLDLL